VALAAVFVGLFAAMALWLKLPAPQMVRGGMAAIVLVLGLIAAVSIARARYWTRVAVFGVTLLLVAGWWSTLRPSNDRNWLADVARPPTAEFHGDIVTIHNLRNFDYRTETDYYEQWETRSYDLSKLTGVDLFLSHWSSPAIAHTIVSWEFSDSPPLAISIETRKEKGEQYSSIRGFFRDYELYYVIADERDLVRLRTNYRGEQVFLYRVKMPIEVARALLVDYLEEATRLAEHPRWYNAATHNCTTAIRKHLLHVAARNPFDWRIIVNGYLDELMYERGTIYTGMPFAQLKKRSDITARAKAADQDPEFSERMRVGIPTP
jgi:type IV secretory pathway TrbD component